MNQGKDAELVIYTVGQKQEKLKLENRYSGGALQRWLRNKSPIQMDQTSTH